MGLVIAGGRVVDAVNRINKKLDLYLKGRVIAGIGAEPVGFTEQSRIDASGCIVCPGLVDLRARLRDPGQENKATIKSETRAAVHGGVTSLCVPPDTNPPIDTPAMVHMVRNRGAQVGLARIHPQGAMTVGLKGERLTDMAALADAGCSGISNAVRPVNDTLVMRRAMQYAATFDLTVFLHAQDPWLQGNGVVHEGGVSTRLGLPSIPEAAEIVGVARDLALIETTGVRGHFCQLTSARAVAMVAEGIDRGLPISADVSVHHLHLSDDDIGYFNTQCFVLPPLRSEADKQALRQALQGGVISAVCSDHQPHGADAKLAPFAEAEPGISGLETLLPLMLRLVDERLLKLPQALAAITSRPAQILGLKVGRIETGGKADLCIFDPKQKWTLRADQMSSRGRNSPFLGQSFRGRVRYTIVGGKVVHEAEKPRSSQ